MIGYYAHSHGSGHCNYAQLFGKIFNDSLTVFTDRDYRFDSNMDVVRLENENPDGTEFERDRFSDPPALHYAPVNIRKITRRNNAILDAIVQKKIRLLIVDVSVEIAMLARVSSVPYAYVRLQGNRNDLAHINAFEGASFLLAYFPEEMEDASTPTWIIEKTIYLGFLSKFSLNRTLSKKPAEFQEAKKPILMHLSGFGGNHVVNFDHLANDYDIFSVGPARVGRLSNEVIHIGVVQSTRPYIQHADVIIAACGLNTISEILSLGKRFIALPEKRHYSEQERAAQNLHREKLAVDLNACTSIREALAFFKDWNYYDLPKSSLKTLLLFYKDLQEVGFRADCFLAKRNIGSYYTPRLLIL